ncbi:MAG TPA: glycosyltransferase family 4 protein [Candidatus Paceibacterota bacterium]|nr:glycosyltransferase family 4 protein [Candidatus Paceibacterota bacterium]
MRILTFGWDYPPKRNGGLGVACYGLTRELLNEGVDVVYVLPRRQPVDGDGTFIFADDTPGQTVYEVPVTIEPYQPSYGQVYVTDVYGNKYPTGSTLLDEVQKFAAAAKDIAEREQFDLIHAHDWTSYLAGLAAKAVSGKPLIVHVHATSFDQAASDNVDPAMFAVEQQGFAGADVVVTVSEYTKHILITKHGVDPAKIEVIHNGADTYDPPQHQRTLTSYTDQGYKIVLYHGRITIQKGVDYFVRAAKRVLAVEPKTIFVISGWGDMQQQIIDLVGELGLSEHVIFAGALWEEERDRMYQSADLVVMPSVSEPFGLIPFEALQNGTPTLISKQSGVGEVMPHVLKADFWDIEEIANQIVAALRYPVLNQQLILEGRRTLHFLSWSFVAKKVKRLYERLVQYLT